MPQRLRILFSNFGTFRAGVFLAFTLYFWCLFVVRLVRSDTNPELGLLAAGWIAGLLLAVLARETIRQHAEAYNSSFRPALITLIALLLGQQLFDIGPLPIWAYCLFDVAFSLVVHSSLWFYSTFHLSYAVPEEIQSRDDPFT